MEATLTAPVARRDAFDPAAGTPRLFDGGPTLEELVLGAWDDLVSEGRAACPLCTGTMSPLSGCERCGSELS